MDLHRPATGNLTVQVFQRRCTRAYAIHGANSIVSIHAPAWGATPGGWCSVGSEQVSIHAPAWGATTVQVWGPVLADVSIHAPAWGATLPPARDRPLAHSFSPCPRVGGNAPANRSAIPAGVSIHAPAWGATDGVLDSPNATVFQSMPPRGGQRRPRINHLRTHKFQSMPPRGGQPYLQV